MLVIALLAMLERNARAQELSAPAAGEARTLDSIPAEGRPDQDVLAIEAQLFTSISAAESEFASFSEFEASRTELGALYRFGNYGAELRLEGVR